MRTDRIGDVVLSTPAIKNIRRTYPESYIAFMCRPYTKDVLEGNPYLNEVIVYDKYGKHKGFFSTLKFSRHLAKKKFDWAIILHPTNRANMVTFLAGIPFRVGWDKKMGFFLNKRIPHLKHKGEKHELEYSLDILREVGIQITDKEPFIPENQAEDSWVESLLKENNIDYKRDRVVGLGIGASCPSKVWPSRYFGQLADKLKEELKAKIIVLAEAKEERLTAEFRKIYGQDFLDLTGKLSLARAFALLRKLSLFIGNDSGLIHVCWAVKTPVISIFGRKDPGLSPKRWAPLGKDSYIFHKDAGCDKCLAHNCKKGYLCLEAIKPKEVFDKALAILFLQN